MKKLQQKNDEWCDDGEWHTAIDFNDIEEGGIPVIKLLKILKIDFRTDTTY